MNTSKFLLIFCLLAIAGARYVRHQDSEDASRNYRRFQEFKMRNSDDEKSAIDQSANDEYSDEELDGAAAALEQLVKKQSSNLLPKSRMDLLRDAVSYELKMDVNGDEHEELEEEHHLEAPEHHDEDEHHETRRGGKNSKNAFGRNGPPKYGQGQAPKTGFDNDRNIFGNNGLPNYGQAPQSDNDDRNGLDSDGLPKYGQRQEPQEGKNHTWVKEKIASIHEKVKQSAPNMLDARKLLDLIVSHGNSSDKGKISKHVDASVAEVVAVQTFEGDVLWIEARFANESDGAVKPHKRTTPLSDKEKLHVLIPTGLAILPVIAFWVGYLYDRV